ncbi:hypothetical protein NQ318_008058 [Aromia moschata]|uniref:HTH CENPB-type domain-containing protein n=1 Tax=Aromia moschata TaxID=1265417 RepID=A0AAV8YN96_9CUCU|nr:hypothetical protein NQ318_008058 [Aromia moschata]
MAASGQILETACKIFAKYKNLKKVSHGPSPVLSVEEEHTLVEWILECQRKGFPRRKTDIKISVKKYLDEVKRTSIFRDNLPGDKWFNAFLRRPVNLRVRTSEAVTNASSQISAKDIKSWFIKVQSYLKEKELFLILDDPAIIFNGDETAFMLCPKKSKIVAQKGSKDVYEVDTASAKSNLTVMFSFCANGLTTPPMIIYPYKRMPKDILNNFPDGWGLGYSDNGWMKAELFYEYIANVFHKSLVANGVKFTVILFVDGHKTHMTIQLSKLCNDLEIILIALYPSATRILQPADVAAFKPLKNDWKDVILDWRRNNPMRQLSKQDFAPHVDYPWNFSAIDIKKCLGKTFENHNEQPVEINNPQEIITYDKFCAVVGDETIQKFRNLKGKQPDKQDDAVYDVWKIFKVQNAIKSKDNEMLIGKVVSGDDRMESFPEGEYEERQDKRTSNFEDAGRYVAYTSDVETQSLDEGYTYLMDITGLSAQPPESKENEVVTFNLEDIPIVFTEPNKFNENNITIDIVNPDQEYNKHVDVQNNDNDKENSLVNYLTWPGTPERKNKHRTYINTTHPSGSAPIGDCVGCRFVSNLYHGITERLSKLTESTVDGQLSARSEIPPPTNPLKMFDTEGFQTGLDV